MHALLKETVWQGANYTKVLVLTLSPPLSLVSFTISWSFFYWGKCALHSICTEIVIFYCIYLKNKQGALKLKKKNKDHQIFQSNVVYFICIYFLKLTLEVKRVTNMLDSLAAWVMVLLFTPCPNLFCRTKESVARFYCNIPFFLVFSSTVLCCLNFFLLPL